MTEILSKFNSYCKECVSDFEQKIPQLYSIDSIPEKRHQVTEHINALRSRLAGKITALCSQAEQTSLSDELYKMMLLQVNDFKYRYLRAIDE